MRPSWVEVDLEAVAHNVATLSRIAAPSRLCAVVKADGYGHGDVPVAEAALGAGAEWLAVALVEEGARLREAGIEAPILLLSEPPPADAGEVIRWRLTPTVYRVEFLQSLGALGSPVGVHLKVDTGMHRVGASPEDVPDLARLAGSFPGVRIEALWTHFAVADEDPSFTRVQLERFQETVSAVRHVTGEQLLLHSSNTAGTILFPEARFDMVRTGLGIYGLHPCGETRHLADLRPAMSVVSHVSHVRWHPAGTRPSYGRRRPLPDDGWVATVPVGYADGVPRLLSQRGAEVLVGGVRRPLAGTVTMDQIVVDLGPEPVPVGTEVVLIGAAGDDRIDADEWARLTETINYEIVCGIGPRLPRRYRP